MTLIEALNEVMSRSFARRPHWNKNEGLTICTMTGFIMVVDYNKPMYMFSPFPNHANQWRPRYEDIVATDWELWKSDALLPPRF